MLEIIGAGLGRTGTHSLGNALTTLGFGPCYHIHEVSKNSGHPQIWNDAMDGKPIPWKFLVSAYQSSVEWPIVAFLPEALTQFPEAKVILTLRDPKTWYESFKTTILDALALTVLNPDPLQRASSLMIRRLILDHTFRGRSQVKEHAIEVYRKHNQWVLDTVPQDRLLPYDIKEGWPPVCAFLEKSIPNEPFPRINRRADFLASAPSWAKKINKALGDGGA